MLRIHLNPFSVTNPRVTKPELIAECKKYRLRPRHSPQNHQSTAKFDFLRQLAGERNRWVGKPWAYHHYGRFTSEQQAAI
jgi:hypothetical protein